MFLFLYFCLVDGVAVGDGVRVAARRARAGRGAGGPGRPAPGAQSCMCIGQTAGLQLITHALETDTHAHTSHTFTQPPARSGDNCDSAKRSTNEADAPLRPS